MLSAAFHPDYANNGFFYVNYTDVNGDTVIARYSVSGDPNIANPNSAVILAVIPQPSGFHNGGQLQFGPDGYLYIGMGDGGSPAPAQNLNSLLGKMLRVDVDNGFPFAIPPDNPFVGVQGAQDEIWAYGLRNPWRFSFDRFTGDLFIADVGENDWEEANFHSASSAGGENYGWSLMEGSSCFNPPANCNDGTLTLPIVEYSHALGCAIVGGYRYRGAEIPQLLGTYLYSDNCSGRIWGATEISSNVWTTTEFTDTNFSVSSFGEDEFGEIYFTHFSQNGAIYRLSSDSQPCPPGDPLSICSNQANFVTGETLSVTLRRDNPGFPLTVDFYAGVILPDGDTVVSFTDPGSTFGSLSNTTTLIPFETGVDLSTPVVIDDPNFFLYTWLGGESAGTYVLFLAAVLPGAFDDGTNDPGDVLELSTSSIVFTP